MTIKRGEIWIANLEPTQGYEQSGIRPVLILQNETISKYSKTVLAIPLTKNLRRASLPSCLLIPSGEGGITQDSVALCHQMRSLDQARLELKLGTVNPDTLARLEGIVLFTLGY